MRSLNNSSRSALCTLLCARRRCESGWCRWRASRTFWSNCPRTSPGRCWCAAQRAAASSSAGVSKTSPSPNLLRLSDLFFYFFYLLFILLLLMPVEAAPRLGGDAFSISCTRRWATDREKAQRKNRQNRQLIVIFAKRRRLVNFQKRSGLGGFWCFGPWPKTFVVLRSRTPKQSDALTWSTF